MKCFSAGYHEISSYEYFFDILGPILTSDCFNTLPSTIFPDELVTRKVICLHKNDDIKLISYYQPTSILSYLSKVIEKVESLQGVLAVGNFSEKFSAIYIMLDSSNLSMDSTSIPILLF